MPALVPRCHAVRTGRRVLPGLVLAVLVAGGLVTPGPAAAASSTTRTDGEPEGCLECHAGMTGFAPAHDPKVIGCAVCHLGDRFARKAGPAHAGMTRTPGNLSVVRRTCATATCHAAIGERIRNSPMNTMSGVVAVDKYVFGENPDLDRPFVVGHLGHSPADAHLRTLCASCHLGHDKTAPAPIDETSRGGGCSACHLDYGARAREELVRRGRPGLTPLTPQAHPQISVQVADQACFGCHSRSGRISTNYEGWHETLLDEAAVPTGAGARDKFRVLADGRVFEHLQADVHFSRGLTCTDCHVATEVMGDNRFHPHEEDAVAIACIDCHAATTPVTRAYGELDPETQMVVALRGLAAPGRQFFTTVSGRATLPNVFVDESGATRLIARRSGAVLQPKPLTAACGRAGTGHAALECRACHSAWASQCVSCHTQAEPHTPGWDHLAGRMAPGSWSETPGGYFADPPALGVRTESDPRGGPGQSRVTTVVPGMILTLNQHAAAERKPDEFHRLYAPVSPHTTSSRVRDCQSCHAQPSALGYGRGKLDYVVTGASGRWVFIPELALLPADGLPADAWIGFLQTRTDEVATRTNLRPFNVEEQRRILRVGACLTCHTGDSSVMRQAVVDFAAVLDRRDPRCAVPLWP